MFTDKAQTIISMAKDRAYTLGRDSVDVESLTAAISADNEAGIRLAECLTKGDVADLRGRCPEFGSPGPCPGTMPPDEAMRSLLAAACELAGGEGVPDRTHPGLVGLPHLICAAAMTAEVANLLGDPVVPIGQRQAMSLLACWMMDSDESLSLGELTSRLRGLRAELLSKVFGQDHAVHAFVEGLYNAQVTAGADRDRKQPIATFVFAGPPGVGKTYLAELCAAHLKRPFKRFDMTAYSDNLADRLLHGFEPSYQGAKPGLLTGFVKQNPYAILLFDEIEKAHLNTMQLFYQILDAGRLHDKFDDEDVCFRDTIIIFTTNAGRSLYDNPNRSGISAANSTYHRRTILSALENEKNPTTRQPAFPPAICSRLGQGYPLVFNHLDVNELVRIVNNEMLRTETLLEKQYFKTFRHDAAIPLSVILREGADMDARQLRSQAERFVKTELFKFCSLYSTQRIEEVLDSVDEVEFCSAAQDLEHPEIRVLFEPTEAPKVLLVADSFFVKCCHEQIKDVNWLAATNADELMERLALEEVDLVLLDLWFRPKISHGHSHFKDLAQSSTKDLDHIPLSARALDAGREMLRLMHERFPQIPVYLLSLDREAGQPDSQYRENTKQSAINTITLDAKYGESKAPGELGATVRKPIDEELFLACVRAGGARGLFSTNFGTSSKNKASVRERFETALKEICLRLHREKSAKNLTKQRKILSYDTIPHMSKSDRRLSISLRNYRLKRAIAADDVGEMLDDVERPRTRFADVIGADTAKEELQSFVDYLKNPKRFAALGLKPPKGILLYGPPGTGKTLLARAIAGESDVAFIATTGNSFKTKWYGESEKAIRDLFTRARRYAPSIIFIDEIDGIGRERTGERYGDEVLNQLLTEMDGFASEPSDRPVLVLGATNADIEESKEDSGRRLDPALKRRFTRNVLVDLPDRAARQKYIEMHLKDRAASTISKQGIERLVERSAGMSIADLETIIDTASRDAAKSKTGLSDEILDQTFKTVRYAEARGKVGAMEVDRPRTKFDEVIGADRAKEELKFVVDYLKNPEPLLALGLKPPKGILLHGPPGTGKTLLARAVAGESEVAFIQTTGNTFKKQYYGESEKAIRELFDKARRFAPAIIFIDEIDSIGKERTGHGTDSVLNQLLTEMDGFKSPAADRPVIVLAATNFAVKDRDPERPSPKKLDPALVRRFTTRIKVDLPLPDAREKYLRQELKGRPGREVSDATITNIAQRSIGFSISTLKDIIDAAGRKAFRLGCKITDELILDAFETERSGERTHWPPGTQQRVAYHEAGHAVMYWLSGWWPAFVTLVSRDDHGGYMEHCAEELLMRDTIQTREQMLASIRVSLGGRSAETLIYGPEAGLSSGPGGDLKKANKIAKQMVCDYGMDEELGLQVSKPRDPRVVKAVDRILKKELEHTMELITEHRKELDAVAMALIEKEELKTEDLKQILPEIPKQIERK